MSRLYAYVCVLYLLYLLYFLEWMFKNCWVIFLTLEALLSLLLTEKVNIVPHTTTTYGVKYEACDVGF